MSNWTHVAGIIRVNDMYCLSGGISPQNIIGNDIPYGSEGRLNVEIWENPDKSCVAAYTISVFGDLRDHDSADDIIDWFKKLCNKFISIRDAIIIARNEQNGKSVWVYEDDE